MILDKVKQAVTVCKFWCLIDRLKF